MINYKQSFLLFVVIEAAAKISLVYYRVNFTRVNWSEIVNATSLMKVFMIKLKTKVHSSYA